MRNSQLPVSPPSPSRWLGMSWSAGLALGAWETVMVGFVVVTGGSPEPHVTAPPGSSFSGCGRTSASRCFCFCPSYQLGRAHGGVFGGGGLLSS